MKLVKCKMEQLRIVIYNISSHLIQRDTVSQPMQTS